MSEETTTETTKKAKKATNGEAAAPAASLFGHTIGHAKDNTLHVPLGALVFPDFDGRAGEKPLPEEFVASVAEGIREPVLVAPIKGAENKYVIVAGRRRVRAAKEAKLKEVPVRIIEIPTGTSPSEMDALLATITFQENLQRENPNDWDIAVGCKRLIDAGFTQDQVAGICLKGVPWVSQHLGLMKLDTRVQNLCRAHANGEGMFSKARQLLRISDADQQYEVAKDAFSKEKMWTSNDVQNVVEKIKAKEAASAEREAQKAKAPKKRAAKGEAGAADPEEAPESPYAKAKVEIGARELRELLDMYDRKLRGQRDRDAGDDKIAYTRGVLDGLKMAGGLKDLPKSLVEGE